MTQEPLLVVTNGVTVPGTLARKVCEWFSIRGEIQKAENYTALQIATRKVFKRKPFKFIVNLVDGERNGTQPPKTLSHYGTDPCRTDAFIYPLA